LKGNSMGRLTFRTEALTVALGAQVTANIQARRAVIHGSLSGNVLAREKIEIRRTARVTGDLVTAGIVVQEGASFNGSIQLIRDEAFGLSVARTSAAKGGQSQP
jgi:cytoskeletal protein CcmA (bactofilin family)